MKTKQSETWQGEFGAEYTKRNNITLEDYEALYVHARGVTWSDLNKEFFGALQKDARILEVGTNVGCQLALLARAGFSSLYGVELQWPAIDEARRRVPRANIVQGTALDLPFKDGFFDLVFTSGVLIHIAPENLDRVLGEIVRCSRRYIFGDEYWAETLREIPYRGNDGLLWKGDYVSEYQRRFANLRVVRERKTPYLDGSGNANQVFLLEQ